MNDSKIKKTSGKTKLILMTAFAIAFCMRLYVYVVMMDKTALNGLMQGSPTGYIEEAENIAGGDNGSWEPSMVIISFLPCIPKAILFY